MNEAEIRERLNNSPLATEIERIMTWVRPAVRMHSFLAEEQEPRIGASHMGGAPDLPPGTAWPENNGRPLEFLAQIDLGDVSAVRKLPGLPPEGWLVLFYDVESGYEWEAPGWRVGYLTGPASELVRIRHPNGEDAEFNACDLSFAPEHCLPDPSDTLPGFSEWVRNHWQAYWEVWKEPELDMEEPHHRIGGWPMLIQNGMDDPDWKFLLQIDSDEETGWMWGDAGRLYYFLHRESLAKGAFHEAWCLTECY